MGTNRAFSIRAVFAAVLAIAIVTWIATNVDLGDAQWTINRESCKDNLAKLYAGLTTYVSTNGDVPRDAEGRLDLFELARFAKAEPQTPDGQPYLISTRLRAEHFETTGDSVPILFDPITSHVLKGGVRAHILYSDGLIETWSGTAREYEAILENADLVVAK